MLAFDDKKPGITFLKYLALMIIALIIIVIGLWKL